jgi:hypothetical protein
MAAWVTTASWPGLDFVRCVFASLRYTWRTDLQQMEYRNLPRPLTDPEFDDLDSEEVESSQTPRQRQIQRRLDARLQAAESQKQLAQAMEKNARYMLWSTIIAGIVTVLAAGAIVFAVFGGSPHALQ